MKRTTYKDFEAGMLVKVVFPRKLKKNIHGYLFRIVNVHKINNIVNSVYVKNIAIRHDPFCGHYIFKEKDEVTSHIQNPSDYFKGMKLEILK